MNRNYRERERPRHMRNCLIMLFFSLLSLGASVVGDTAGVMIFAAWTLMWSIVVAGEMTP